MTDPKFKKGDDVLVIGGDYKGHYGRVVDFTLGIYLVSLPELQETGYFGVREANLELLDEVTGDPEPEPEVKTNEVFVPAFGMTEDQFVAHMEYLMTRALGRVTTTGPGQAFYGFQEFETLTPPEVLAKLMIKLEEGMALLAQAHVLIGRTALALENPT
jgi:hypothetical protein